MRACSSLLGILYSCALIMFISVTLLGVVKLAGSPSPSENGTPQNKTWPRGSSKQSSTDRMSVPSRRSGLLLRVMPGHRHWHHQGKQTSAPVFPCRPPDGKPFPHAHAAVIDNPHHPRAIGSEGACPCRPFEYCNQRDCICTRAASAERNDLGTPYVPLRSVAILDQSRQQPATVGV
jgi:hypothetical protein